MSDIPSFTRGVARSKYPAAQRRRNNKIAESAAAPSGDVVNTNQTARACHVGNAVATSVPAGTSLVLTWTSEVFDTDGWFDAGSPTKITVDRSGVYLIQSTIRAEPTGGTATVETEILKNGVFSTDDNGYALDSRGTVEFSQFVSQLASLVAGDEIEIKVNAAINDVGVQGTNFSVAFLGSV